MNTVAMNFSGADYSLGLAEQTERWLVLLPIANQHFCERKSPHILTPESDEHEPFITHCWHW
jgi:hypothetical protein